MSCDHCNEISSRHIENLVIFKIVIILCDISFCKGQLEKVSLEELPFGESVGGRNVIIQIASGQNERHPQRVHVNMDKT